jgi:hypothetical protein
MNYLLKAMGFWIWGLIAIAISVSVVAVSYRTIGSLRPARVADSGSAPVGGSTSFESAAPGLERGNQSATAASGEPAISKPVRKEVLSAQDAMHRGQWSEVLSYLDAADSKTPVSSYDEAKTEEFRGYSEIKLKDLRAAQKAYEAAVATGAYKAEELVRIFRLLFQLAAQNGDNAKAIEYGQRIVADGNATQNDLLVMSQLYYQQKDCKNSTAWGDRAASAYKEAGEAPKEVIYQIQLQCASDAGDTKAMLSALYELVRLTNKTSYWNNLIRLERQEERVDRNTLMIYRVMYDTHSMQADTDYIEMAQLLGDAGLPGEGREVLEKALRSNFFKDEHRERAQRLLAALKTRADADIAGLHSLAVDAVKSPNGQLYLTLGQIDFGAGSFEDAASAIRLGLAKGQLDRLDDAYVTLGRSLVAQRDLADADKAFAKLKSVPDISPRVLRLWNLYAETRAVAAASASL